MAETSRKVIDMAKLSSRGWVSLLQFSQITGLSYPTILSYRDKGHFRFLKVGGIYRVSIDEVNRFLKEGNLKGKGTKT